MVTRVSLSAAACLHYCTDPDVTWGVVGIPPSCALLGRFAIGARVALLWQHYGNAWHSPTHAGEDTPRWQRACCVRRSISSILQGAAMRTRNVSEYMLVLNLCPVIFVALNDNVKNAYKIYHSILAAPQIWQPMQLCMCLRPALSSACSNKIH